MVSGLLFTFQSAGIGPGIQRSKPGLGIWAWIKMDVKILNVINTAFMAYGLNLLCMHKIEERVFKGCILRTRLSGKGIATNEFGQAAKQPVD